MIKNYLTLALKVLRRKPFYTFISLFGISFTLMILMLITSLGDAMLGSNRPMSNQDQMVILKMLERYTTNYDTIRTIDTVYTDGGSVRYDTTETLEDNGSRNTSQGGMSYAFVNDYLGDFEGIEAHTFFSSRNQVDGYLDGQKISFRVCYTDAAYWQVFDFEFLHGEAYRSEDIAAGNRVVVVTEKAAREYFGLVGDEVVGREMELGRDRFTVRGVVARPLSDNALIGSDVFLPATTADQRMLAIEGLQGGFAAVFLAESPAKRKVVQKQIDFLAENFTLPPDDPFDDLKLHSATSLEDFAKSIVGSNEPDTAVLVLFVPLAVLILLFMVLPLINLVNLNISRVHERSAEIAVRKAFGADSRNILYQFLFENMVLTAMGGTAGLVLAYATIRYVNSNDLLGNLRLSFSPTVFVYALFIIIGFGLLSGLLPALRMSRTNVANSLR